MKQIKHPNARGVSLIELMIALLIGSLLILGLVEVFAASRTAYQMSEGMARVQENSRFAMDYLQRDLRMAGHFGCVNDQSHMQSPGELHSHFSELDGPLNFTASVQGYEAADTAPGKTVTLSAPADGWVPALPAFLTGLANKPLPGSDVVVLRYLSSDGVPITAFTAAPGTTTIQVDAANWDTLASNGITDPKLFGIADCNYADIFQAATNPGTGTLTVTKAGLNEDDFTSDRYSASPAGQAMVYRAESVAYYIANSATPGQKALWRVRFNSGAGGALEAMPEELVEGVENLQLVYGLDRSTDASKPSGYIEFQRTADAIAANEWWRVGTIRVGILAKSPNRAAATTPDEAAGQLMPSALGVRFAAPLPSDGFYRTTYESTIALRNRLYGN